MTDCRGDDQDAADAAAADADVVLHLALFTGQGGRINVVQPGQRVAPMDVTSVKANSNMAVARLDMAAALALQARLQQVTGHYPSAVAAPAVDHSCSSCGTSLARCDTRIRNRRPACCTLCGLNDTHNDPMGGYAERERARAARGQHADVIDEQRGDW